MAFVRVRPLPGHLHKIAELARVIPEITECHRMTGEDCFILKMYLKAVATLDGPRSIPRARTNYNLYCPIFTGTLAGLPLSDVR